MARCFAAVASGAGSLLFPLSFEFLSFFTFVGILVLLAGPSATVCWFYSPRNRNIESGNEEKPHDGGMAIKAGALEDSG